MQQPTGFDELNDPPTDGITAVSFNPADSRYLLASSWDKTARYYDVQDNKLAVKFEHSAAVLDISFGPGKQAFSGTLDNKVNVLDLETGSIRVLGTHDGPVRCVCWSSDTGLVYSGSWDKTLRVWDPRKDTSSSEDGQGALVTKLDMPAKVFSMDLRDSKLMVAMSNRHIYVYDIKDMNNVQKRESFLRYMLRSGRLMPDGTGFANSSIEGRIALEFFDPELHEKKKYAFKSHRLSINDDEVVYPVHALAFHSCGTFVSGGADCVVSVWDGVARKRIRQFSRFPEEISSLSFSPDGRMLAVASSYTFDEGERDNTTDKIFIRTLVESDYMPRNSSAATNGQ